MNTSPTGCKILAIAVFGVYLFSGCSSKAGSQEAGIPVEVADAIRHRDLAKLEAAVKASPRAVNARDEKTGYTTLFTAIRFQFPQGAQLLLSKGADPDGKVDIHNEGDSAKMSPLMFAVSNHLAEFVELLLKAGADPNASSLVGGGEETPLVMAAFTGNEEIARMLLAAKANPNMIASGASALDVAREKNDTGMIELLESAPKVAQGGSATGNKPLQESAASAQTTNNAPSEGRAAEGTVQGHLTVTHVSYVSENYWVLDCSFTNLNGERAHRQVRLWLQEIAIDEPLAIEKNEKWMVFSFELVAVWPQSISCAVYRSSADGEMRDATDHLRKTVAGKYGTCSQIRQAMLKFQEWSALARQKRVVSFEKPLTEAITFKVDEAGVPCFQVTFDDGGREILGCGTMIDSQFIICALDSGEIEKVANQLVKQRKKNNELFK